MDFTPGDVVQLKSGGPMMTVTHADETGVTCIWFDKTKQQVGSFPLVTVLKPTPRRPIRVRSF